MQERSEQPTPHKLKKAKERGEGPNSIELSRALALLGALFLLWALASLFSKAFKDVFFSTYTQLIPLESEQVVYDSFLPLFLPVFLMVGGIFLLTICLHFFQKGWIWRRSTNKKRGRERWILPLLKIGAIVSIGYYELKNKTPHANLLFSSSGEKLSLIFKNIFFILLEVALAFLLLAFCDYFYQRWKYNKDMRMTPQEVREEKREREGNTKYQMRNRH